MIIDINKNKFRNTIRYIFLAGFIFIASYSFSNAQFGKNKVQYQTYNWMFIQSEHFDIYYDLGSKYIAEFTAYVAEKALLTIQSDLSYNINRRVPIILYNSHVQFQQTNAISSYMPEGVGGVTELFKNRIVLPFTGNYEGFRHVIVHELLHAVMNDMFFGGTFQTIVASGSDFQIPIWIAEGLAEWESLKSLTPHTDMFIRDLVIANLLPELSRLDGYLAYRGGQIFFWYIADNYGEGKIGELINKLNAYRNLEMAFKGTFNMTLEEFSEKWSRDLKKMYLPDVKTFEDPTDFAENLTNHKKTYNEWNTSPSISPNGKKFAYISEDNGVYAIYIKDLDDKKSDPQKLVSSFRQQDFEELNLLTPGISWNPTGDKLAISAKSGGENAVFIVDVNSGNYEKLTWGLRSITSVSWSPDGKKIAFTATLPVQSDIFVYDFTSKKLDNLTNDIFSDAIPEWSSDSKNIYFVSDRQNNLSVGESGIAYKIWKTDYDAQDLYSIDIANKKLRRLTFDPKFNKSSIAASNVPDKILFVSDKNGIDNIYELNLTNLKVTPKTNSILGITQISLSPDGSKLLFSGQNGGGYDIFYMRFPFEKKIANDELPQTLIRESKNAKSSLISELSEIVDKPQNDSIETLPKYGDFQIDFSRQNFLQANPDLTKKQVSEAPVKSEVIAENEEFTEKPYKILFTPDVIMGNPNYNNYYGFQSLAQMLFSDIMGDHQIYFQGYFLTDLKNSSFLVNYSYLPKLIDYGATIYHNSIITYGLDGFFYRYRNLGLSFDASLPFDLFRRLDFNLGFMNINQENINYPQDPTKTTNLLVPTLKYVMDNTINGWYGPVRGMRYYISAFGSPRLYKDGPSFYNFETDIRFYQPIISNYLSLALRGSAGGSFGETPTRYFMGGTENWIFGRTPNDNYIPLNDALDYAFLQFKMPLRGWSIGEKTGNKFFLVNTELRFPLFTALVAGPVPILLQGVQAALFFDMGGAFNEEFIATQKNVWGKTIPKDMMMSTGLGVRTYFLGLPFKLDVAWTNLYYTWSKPLWMFSLGYDF